MSIAFVVDPLGSLVPDVDTSVGLMRAAAARGDQVWVTCAGDLEVVDGQALAAAKHITPLPPIATHDSDLPGRWYSVESDAQIRLAEMDAVFMRTDPPVDAAYLHATYVLDLVDPATTLLVNDPRGLRLCNEKMYALRFPELVPPTVVSAHAGTILAFVKEHGRAVVKPVDGFGGQGVLLLDVTDLNLRSLTELVTQDSRRAVVVQRYLHEVAEGNKRVFVVDGVPTSAVWRYPADGDFRIGPPAALAPVTQRDLEICERLAPSLRRDGLRMVGLDVIGSYLIEINVTSPGALGRCDRLLGTAWCAAALDALTNKRDSGGNP